MGVVDKDVDDIVRDLNSPRSDSFHHQLSEILNVVDVRDIQLVPIAIATLYK